MQWRSGAGIESFFERGDALLGAHILKAAAHSDRLQTD
jgi:hypothetical protein